MGAPCMNINRAPPSPRLGRQFPMACGVHQPWVGYDVEDVHCCHLGRNLDAVWQPHPHRAIWRCFPIRFGPGSACGFSICFSMRLMALDRSRWVLSPWARPVWPVCAPEHSPNKLRENEKGGGRFSWNRPLHLPMHASLCVRYFPFFTSLFKHSLFLPTIRDIGIERILPQPVRNSESISERQSAHFALLLYLLGFVISDPRLKNDKLWTQLWFLSQHGLLVSFIFCDRIFS